MFTVCVCSLLTAVCVHLDGLNAEHQFRVWVTILDNTSHNNIFFNLETIVRIYFTRMWKLSNTNILTCFCLYLSFWSAVSDFRETDWAPKHTCSQSTVRGVSTHDGGSCLCCITCLWIWGWSYQDRGVIFLGRGICFGKFKYQQRFSKITYCTF